MGSKWVMVLVLFMFVSLQGCLSQISGCWEEERVALLQLKHFFNRPNSLRDWVELGDCCQWGAVTCNGSTGRVISLFLQDTRDRELREWYLNASLFSAFEQLEALNLSWNSIAGFVENKGSNKLLRLSNLKNLDLSYNRFNNNIFSSLGALSSLNTLYLNGNGLKGVVNVSGLDSLYNLESLHMGNNEIGKLIFPKGLRGLKYLYLENVGIHDGSSLASIPSLVTLDLSYNNFSEMTTTQEYLHNFTFIEQLRLDGSSLHISLLQSIVVLTSPRQLWMQNCQVNGVLGSQEYLNNFTNVEWLNLDGSSLHISLLRFIGAFTSLNTLSMRSCQLNGILDFQGSDWLSRLSNLEYLYLEENMFNNSILSSLGAVSSLKGLYLSDNRLKGTVDVPDSLNNLEALDMSNNEIDKFVFRKGLKKLEYLYLQNVSIHDGISSVLHSLASLPSLRVLDLRFNNFSESTTTKDGSSHHSIAAFTNLEILDLENCQIYGTSSFQDLLNFTSLTGLNMGNSTLDISFFQIGMMPSLKSLSLNNCELQGSLSNQDLLNFTSLKDLDMDNTTLDISFFQIGMMASLVSLSITNCELQGSLSNQDLPNFKNLKSLYMDHTGLDLGFLQMIGLMTSLETLSLVNCGLQSTLLPEDGGAISKFLNHQQYLRSLDLANNNLTGGFPNWLLENNTELEDLNLANNLLGGYLSIHSHMNLTTLDISNNSFQGHIPKEVADLPSLETLNLSRNHFDGSIPSSIGDLNSLQSLDLSYNNLSGEIPEHLAEGCTSLSVLVLSNNKLRGKIFSAKFNLTDLQALQLNGNSFTGSIPDSLSKASDLVGLYLGDNKLSGMIPSWLGNMSSLEVIIMPNNHFEGPIPLEFCQFQSLEVLNLAENNLSGSLPSCSTPSSIIHVHLSKNKLQGQLKEAFFNSSSIETLDLGHNHFDGRIPTWIGRLSQLTYLVLSNNNLEGDVPTQLCQLNQLQLVDLSHNNLSGYIPPCLDFTALHSSDHEVASHFHENCEPRSQNRVCLTELHRNRFEESVEFTTKTLSYSYHGKVLTYMSGVDLSCNKLTGPIPPQVGNLTRIHTLNLSHNNLTGPIPMTFSKLEQIESLDLSYNNLNGKIPPQLVDLYTLSSFNVAHNNLSGRTPERVAQFNTFDENSYEGNPLLCGPPLHKSCETTRQPSPMPGASTDKEEDNDLIDMNIFYMSFTGSYIIVLLGIVAVLYINPYWRRVWFYLAERWMTSCYYFIVDNLPHRFCH